MKILNEELLVSNTQLYGASSYFLLLFGFMHLMCCVYYVLFCCSVSY